MARGRPRRVGGVVVSRARTLADVVPLAWVEPDGLLLTSAGGYVRSLALERVLQPLGGGRAHRDAMRDRLAALAARLPAGQRLQVLIEAEPLDAARVLTRDWQEITAAGGAGPSAEDP